MEDDESSTNSVLPRGTNNIPVADTEVLQTTIPVANTVQQNENTGDINNIVVEDGSNYKKKKKPHRPVEDGDELGGYE